MFCDTCFSFFFYLKGENEENGLEICWKKIAKNFSETGMRAWRSFWHLWCSFACYWSVLWFFFNLLVCLYRTVPLNRAENHWFPKKSNLRHDKTMKASWKFIPNSNQNLQHFPIKDNHIISSHSACQSLKHSPTQTHSISFQFFLSSKQKKKISTQENISFLYRLDSWEIVISKLSRFYSFFPSIRLVLKYATLLNC